MKDSDCREKVEQINKVMTEMLADLTQTIKLDRKHMNEEFETIHSRLFTLESDFKDKIAKKAKKSKKLTEEI